ncbi:hypothetical protein MASR2M29_02040 [Spirochaetota bacterium]
MAQKSKRDDGSRVLPNLYGYDPDRNTWNQMAPIIPAERNYIQSIFNLFTNDRYSASKIAVVLNKYQTDLVGPPWCSKEFTSDFVLKILKRVEYTGRTKDRNGEIITSKIYGEIIPPEQYDLAQFILITRKDRQISGSNLRKYPLSGFLSCQMCDHKRYHVKYANSSTRSPYYYHKKYTNTDCLALLNAEEINNIVYSQFIELFTSKNALSKKYEEFIYYHYSNPNANSNPHPNQPFDLYPRIEQFNESLERYYDLVKQMIISPKTLHDRIEGTIESLTSENNETLRHSFLEYLSNVLKDWYSGDDSKKADLIYRYINSAEIILKSLFIQWTHADSHLVRLSPMTDEWKQRIKDYSTKKCFTDKDRKTKLSLLSDYLTILCKKVSADQAKVLFRIANSYSSKLQGLGFLTTKEHLELSSFVEFQNWSDSFDHTYIYRDLATQKVFLSSNHDGIEINPFFVEDRVFAYRLKDSIYFNEMFFHTLPEWFYGYNYEYFKIGKKKICFMQEQNGIQAFELKRLGVKTPIESMKAIELISEDSNAKYIDID